LIRNEYEKDDPRMATLDRAWRSPASAATSLALDAEIEASVIDRPAYPQGTVFVPSDLAGAEFVAEYVRARKPVAIVHDNGRVELRRPRPRRALIAGLVIAGLVFWVLTRRRPAPATFDALLRSARAAAR
jgi:hypothetical protein